MLITVGLLRRLIEKTLSGIDLIFPIHREVKKATKGVVTN
jgi:hypothetical protein